MGMGTVVSWNGMKQSNDHCWCGKRSPISGLSEQYLCSDCRKERDRNEDIWSLQKSIKDLEKRVFNLEEKLKDSQ